MTRLSRTLFTLALAALGASMTGGCIYIPAFGTEGKDVSRYFGEANSDAPLRVGVSTKDEVISLLGEPKSLPDDAVFGVVQSQDPQALTYRWQTRRGYGGMLIGSCSGLGWFKDDHSMTLYFDDRQVIDRRRQD
jgi:hypothetical protein